jgi:menaquinone-dependent protoporphyrinogen IX oxidase
MPGIIIYASRYGSTREYATWLQEETGYELYDVKHAPKDFDAYDTVVVATSIMAGRPRLARWIQERWPALRGKRVAVLLVNVTADPAARAQIVPTALPDIAPHLAVFPVGGRYDVERMGGFDRFMIKTVAKMEKRPEVRAELLETRDLVNRENLREIVNFLRQSGA